MRIDVKKMVAEEKSRLKTLNPHKKMLILQVGDLPESNSYIKGKIKDCEEVGIGYTVMKFDDGVAASDMYHIIENYRDDFDGIILQEPANITKSYGCTKEDVIAAIPDEKDIDGFKVTSPCKHCTPLGIMFILKNLGYRELDNKIVTVIGRGPMVGEPLIPMLIKAGATVIACNSKTPNLRNMTIQADIVIGAANKKDLITRNMLKEGAIVIDAGIIRDTDGKLYGNCNKDLYDNGDVLVTTVPGGVGLTTRLMLLKNLLREECGDLV